jgi:hypothetical protein
MLRVSRCDPDSLGASKDDAKSNMGMMGGGGELHTDDLPFAFVLDRVNPEVVTDPDRLLASSDAAKAKDHASRFSPS